MAVNFTYPSDTTITLDDIDFYVEFYCTPNKVQKIPKSALIREVTEADGVETIQYYALVNTSVIGVGIVKMRMWAWIPDIDAPNETRPEYAEITTNVVIN